MMFENIQETVLMITTVLFVLIMLNNTKDGVLFETNTVRVNISFGFSFFSLLSIVLTTIRIWS